MHSFQKSQYQSAIQARIAQNLQQEFQLHFSFVLQEGSARVKKLRALVKTCIGNVAEVPGGSI